jgi:hypothetical protein
VAISEMGSIKPPTSLYEICDDPGPCLELVRPCVEGILCVGNVLHMISKTEVQLSGAKEFCLIKSTANVRNTL